MGVSGLTGFIDDNPKLLTDYNLHDCRLVIDGNNLYHFIYYRFNVGYLYGGDYDIYAKCIRLFFRALDICNVTPFVVFDGGYAADDRKFKTVLKRLSQRVTQVASASKGHCTNVLPILAGNTFLHTLNELGVSHVTCDSEADEEIAALANYWNCPVLSNDSDFFVFPLNAGVVLLDYLNLSVLKGENGKKHLAAQIFYQDSLLKSFHSADKSMLALFATLLGNDYVESDTFTPFFSQVSLPKGVTKFLSSRRHSKKNGLLLWLEDHETVEKAIEAILVYYKKEERNHIKDIIQGSIRSYLHLEPTMISYIQRHSNSINEKSQLRTYGGNQLPHWFIMMLRKGEVSTQVIDALQLHRVINTCHMEAVQEPSSYEASLALRRVIYGILFNGDKDQQKRFPVERPRSHCVEEWGRDGTSVGTKQIEPSHIISDDCVLPGLDDVPAIPVERRKQILLAALSLPDVSEVEANIWTFDPCFRLPLLAVIFWLKHSQPPVNSMFLISLLTCIVKLASLQLKLQATEETSVEVSDSGAASKKTKDPLEKFHNAPNQDSYVYDSDIVHGFAQFQTSFQALINLNSLLLFPFENISPFFVFNGTFVYNLVGELKSRKCPKDYVLELFGRCSVSATAFENMYCFVLKCVPEVKEVQGQISKKKEKMLIAKRLRRSRKKAYKDTPEAMDEEESSIVALNCDVNNRFSVLGFE